MLDKINSNIEELIAISGKRGEIKVFHRFKNNGHTTCNYVYRNPRVYVSDSFGKVPCSRNGKRLNLWYHQNKNQ